MTKRDWWKERPDEHDHPAAHNHLTLLLPEDLAPSVVEQLRRAPPVAGDADLGHN